MAAGRGVTASRALLTHLTLSRVGRQRCYCLPCLTNASHPESWGPAESSAGLPCHTNTSHPESWGPAEASAGQGHRRRRRRPRNRNSLASCLGYGTPGPRLCHRSAPDPTDSQVAWLIHVPKNVRIYRLSISTIKCM